MKRRRAADQCGFVAAELVAGLALLVVPVTVIVLAMPQWAERETDARAIAREVGRTLARAGWCDVGEASAIVDRMAANVSLPRGDVSVELHCVAETALIPGTDLTVDVGVRMPPVHLPAIGYVAAWAWTARHREPVDLYGGQR